MAEGNTRSDYKDVCTVQHGPIEPHSTDVWEGDKLFIPPIPPSYLMNCNIINIDYTLEV